MMNTNFVTRHSESALDADELQKIASEGYVLLGFTFNSDLHRYDYIFRNRESDAETACESPSEHQSENCARTEGAHPDRRTRFMFKAALINLGVGQQTADDWIKVRRAKKAAQTETAFRIIEKQVKIVADAFGVDPDDVIRVAVDRNWQGLKAEWFDNVDWEFYGVKVGKNDLPFDNGAKWQ